MGKKYEVEICKCGRIHFIDWNEISTACDEEKELLVICGGCGKRRYIGSNKYPDCDNPDGIIHNMYSYEGSPNENFYITKDYFNDKNIYKVFYSYGVRVPMMTGYYATAFVDGKFYDGTYPNTDVIYRKNTTVYNIKKYFEDLEYKISTVDMKSFINYHLTDEQARELSYYYIKGLDWTGTKYERKV